MRPGDTFRGMAHFEDSTGALADADALPVGVLRRNGVTLAGAAVTVTKVGTGSYTWSVLLDPDDGWVTGDTADVEISGSVDGIPMAQSLSAVIGGVRQTGDAYARIGEGGAGLTAVAQASAYTAARAEKLDYLDATVSSRMAGSAYTAPDNAGIAAVKAKTDRLQFSDADDVKATLDGEKVTAQTVEDKTGYSLTADQSGVTIGTVNSLGATAQGQVNTEVDAALNAPIGDAPADGSINERIKALDDAYTVARAEKLDYLDAAVSSVVPTGTGANPVTITLVDTDGAPGMGKTALMLNMAIKQVKNGEKVMIFSLEMSMELLVERMVAEISRVSLQKIRGGDLTDREFDKVVEAFDFLNGIGDKLIIIDKSNMTINEIKLEIRKHKVDVVYIDYLQLINSSSEYNNRNVEVGEVSRVAKVMARELNIAVVMLAQLSREVERRTNKKPILSDLRDSGEIEQNADIVLFLYRSDYYSEIGQEIETEETEIIIAKHRNGPTGSIKLYFTKDTLEFIEYEEGV